MGAHTSLCAERDSVQKFSTENQLDFFISRFYAASRRCRQGCLRSQRKRYFQLPMRINGDQ